MTSVLILLVSVLTPGSDPPVKQPESTPGMTIISPTLRIDKVHRVVILDAEVALREGPLELLLCRKGTKEHESILAADVEPRAFQMALLLVGAKPGKPAQFDPYRPPTGQKIKIWLEIENSKRTELIDARQWVRDVSESKSMAADFVFAGSGFRRVPSARQTVFLGDDGDLVCVANFPGAILDIAAKSSKENADLLFEAWTSRIPARGTRVRVIFEPVIE